MPSDAEIAAAIASAARTMHENPSVEDTLHAICRTARDSVPGGFDEVGISTIGKGGKVTTRASTGELVDELDRLQYTLGEGPCVETLRDVDVLVVPHLRHEQRWPRYVRSAVETGVRAQLAVKLYVDDQGTLGGLNLYSTTTDEIDPAAEPVAELFAAHAAIALGNARRVGQLNEALQSRKLIGQAVGILMERYQLNEERAFAFLMRASSHGNVKLRDVAQELVADQNAREGLSPAESPRSPNDQRRPVR